MLAPEHLFDNCNKRAHAKVDVRLLEGRFTQSLAASKADWME